MTGPLKVTPQWKKERIKKLTKEGVGVTFIAERLGLKITQVYQIQVRLGLRIPKKRKK